MMRKPSSRFGRRASRTSIRSSERLFASSMAYFASFDTLPASSRSGRSAAINSLMRSEMRALRCRELRIMPRMGLYRANQSLQKPEPSRLPDNELREFQFAYLKDERGFGSHVDLGCG